MFVALLRPQVNNYYVGGGPSIGFGMPFGFGMPSFGFGYPMGMGMGFGVPLGGGFAFLLIAFLVVFFLFR